MVTGNVTLRAVAILTAGIVGLAGWATRAHGEDKRLADRDVAEWVQQRVRDWQPTAEDRRFDEIGWAKDIRTAEKLAKDNNRPVFLFTHDGHMAVGRC
jgi:predicted amidohydrolase YtcJ